jgi:hypothetical protein
MGNKMMRKYVILFPVCFLFFLVSGLSQSDQHAATFFGHVKLKKIPTSVGMPFMVKQFFTIKQDSVMHADRYFFENVTIGKIKSCKLDYATRNDTIQSITIYLTGHKNFEAAKKQAKKDFGPAVAVLNFNEEVFTWQTKTEVAVVQISLQRKNQEWGSEIFIVSTY